MRIQAAVRRADPEDARMVLMHGLGSDERDMFGIACELPPSIKVVCPRAPFAYGPGYAWFGVDWQADSITIDVEQYWAAVEIVAGFLPSVGPNLIVGGFSQGAMITYGLLVKHPELIAHAVLLSGRAVGENRPEFSGRVFQAHGLQDEVIPFADADAMRTSLEPLGERLEFHSYPMGHSVSMEEMEDLNAWLKAVTSSSAEL